MNIVFDIDDTLYNLMEPFEKAHEELFAGQTDADCESLFMASRIYSDEAFYMHEKGMLSAEEEFAYRIRKTYADVGIHVSQEQVTLFEQRYRYYQKHIHVPKAIQNILENCRENDVPIAALTNGKHVNQGKKIGVLQLTRWFEEDRIFISEDIGYTKPDQRAFFAVQEALQLDPEKTYTVAGSFYTLQEQGDGFTMFQGAQILQHEELPVDSEMLISYFTDRLNGTVTAEMYGNPLGDGRITILTEKEEDPGSQTPGIQDPSEDPGKNPADGTDNSTGQQETSDPAGTGNSGSDGWNFSPESAGFRNAPDSSRTLSSFRKKRRLDKLAQQFFCRKVSSPWPPAQIRVSEGPRIETGDRSPSGSGICGGIKGRR